MRVTKEFTPILIYIETEEDKKFMLEVLSLASHKKRESWISPLGVTFQEGDFVNKINYLEGKIR